MNSKAIHPAFPPQILLDQFQRPVAPIPGMSLIEYFALEIFKIRYEDYKRSEKKQIKEIFISAIHDANQFLEELHTYQSENNLSTLKIIDNDK
jgi:hypothetical protein